MMFRVALVCMAAAMTIAAPVAANDRIGYLGPAGSWTHQACIDLFGNEALVPLSHDALFADYVAGTVGKICVPVTTSIVGPTPYLDPVLDLPRITIVAEYPKMLSYSLLARPGTQIGDIEEVVAHPVALQEVKPWLDRQMASVRRVEAESGGDAARRVANSTTRNVASMGPPIGASIYGLVSLVDGIEKGPHNVTRWWVLGSEMPAPTGTDKTSMLITIAEDDFSDFLKDLSDSGINILTAYERPTKLRLDLHRYLIEVSGHAQVEPLKTFLGAHSEVRVLGSYPRKY